MNRRHLLVIVVVALALLPLGFVGFERSNLAAQEAKSKTKCILVAPEGYPEHTNCPECLKDDAEKRLAPAGGVTTKDFSKNDHYQKPPVVLGDGHALRIEMDAPGNIVSVSRGCYGLACGWTHDVAYQNMGTRTVTWIGWSNSGENCILSFTITYQ